MENIIFRSQKNLISGYKKIVDVTFDILNKHYSIISLCEDNEQNQIHKTNNLLNRNNFFSNELFISPLSSDKINSFSINLPQKENIILLTMWESDILPRFAVNELNENISQVLVPCAWNLETFKKCKVNNVKLFNLFVDDRYFYYKPKLDLKKFTFVAGANLQNYSSSDSRKNIDFIISCFLKAFKQFNDVELVIKASGCNKSIFPNYMTDKIKFIFDSLTDLQMSDFLSSGDVFVSASKSEGWGFFQIESLAVGRPVVTVNYGGIKEFCSSENSFFIDYEEELACGFLGKGGGSWARLNETSLIENMLYCYYNKDKIRNSWKLYSDSVLPKFNLANYEKKLISVL